MSGGKMKAWKVVTEREQNIINNIERGY